MVASAGSPRRAHGPRGRPRPGAQRPEGLPRPAPRPVGAGAQLGAWAIQLASCYALFVALGLELEAGIGAAACGAVRGQRHRGRPGDPSNIGVFQLAVISVLSGGFGVPAADALAYGVILQAVEIATAVAGSASPRSSARG